MTRLHSRLPLAGLAAAALLALTLAGCAASDTPTTDDTGSSDSSTDSGTDDSSSDSGSLVTIPGSGDYTVGVTAPIGGYSLKGDPTELPDGCTWAVEDENGNTQFTNQGTTVFLTEENKFFQTSGCPNWVQFE